MRGSQVITVGVTLPEDRPNLFGEVRVCGGADVQSVQRLVSVDGLVDVSEKVAEWFVIDVATDLILTDHLFDLIGGDLSLMRWLWARRRLIGYTG
ncbi:hypothetical protein F8O06_05485 [Pseudoclavibacter sp. CFCC 14310]|uniref:hypothetical protein n=1 Tax=Pseudoclavibacter sp. CFCC 14310 TaxID=2615180 RepID=UPI00139E7C3B|nr:hypothetical protein [Pseudoclavibacter sp. CFCC 14310]KAB1646217.1 hypothetical protein F8O06_05485 [Pseudoclavibacter sp. CFCC 14310]